MSAVPEVVDRTTWLHERNALLVREKAHTRQGDAIAAARRRLPMIEVDASARLVGEHGPVSFLDVFEGRDQLIVYKHMWWPGAGIEGQCEGCTASLYDVHDTSYLRHRGVSFAVFTDAPWDEIAPYKEFMGYPYAWYSTTGVQDEAVRGSLVDEPGNYSCYLRVDGGAYLTNEAVGRGVETAMVQAHLLDLTVYGRQEHWEDSPAGWPQQPTGSWWERDGRPVPQWSRPGAAPADPHRGQAARHCCG
ncbi:DUF899 family protein [Kribbella shirazensis]|uniref:Putative dithiol-disulfide oxidoreductase (DUF899 family) n=1 Tax=Kribbella shirazensis TaxID=1105143 RepID=A0A7X5ZY85_9ACTN|nr:DUF899 family protein [Kribbella shirazensis]NIK54663.1 putative dithiol-disulfide oxidoreductase (DUF899 family) [Kribbella shirazensis]